MDKAEELKFVSRRRAAFPILHKLPNSGVFHFILQLHIVYEKLKVNKLGEMIPRKGGFKVDFMYPHIIHKSLRDLSILSLGALNFFWSNVLWCFTLKPWGMPKGGLTPIPKSDDSGGIKNVYVLLGVRVFVAHPNFSRIRSLKP
jgi:hypothetical protein